MIDDIESLTNGDGVIWVARQVLDAWGRDHTAAKHKNARHDVSYSFSNNERAVTGSLIEDIVMGVWLLTLCKILRLLRATSP